MKKNIALVFLLSLLPFFSFADIVTSGEVSRHFTILNLEDYPEYDFYILRQSYRYDRGYQPAGTSKVPVEQGKYMAAGSRSFSSLLFAQPKDSTDSVRVSTIRLGGRQIMQNRNADYIQSDYKIETINDSTIVLKMVERKLVLHGGKEIKLKKGAVSTGIEILGIDLIFFALPVVCLFGIVFFFLYRRRQSRNNRS